jgi:hypothetical protein
VSNSTAAIPKSRIANDTESCSSHKSMMPSTLTIGEAALRPTTHRKIDH